MPAGFPGGKDLGGKQGFGAIQIVAVLAVPIQREAHEGVGVVGFVIQHQLQQVDGQQLVAGGHFCILRGEEAQLLAHAPGVAGLELAGEGVQFLLGHVDGFVLIVTEERQQGLGQPGQVPVRDGGLVAVAVAALMVDRAEHGIRIIGVHEGTGAVVDRLAGNGHVVGVHHTVDETHRLPLHHQGDLACDDPAQHQPVGVELRILSDFGADVRKMPLDGVVGQRLQCGDVPQGCSILEGGDPDMALGGSGQHGPGFRSATMDAVARGDDRETACCRDVQCVHRFADQVFAQHRSQRRLAVALA